MSVITVQLGQCGNQIGSSLFDVISDECISRGKSRHANFDDACSETFFDVPDARSLNSPPVARAVLVDSEHKVISRVVESAGRHNRWLYDKGSQISFRRGSGNNWAHGYCSYGPRIETSFEESTRRQAERCDRLSGFLTLMSLAGGTGSGTGSYLTDHLRDHYPRALVVNQIVWPYSSGEVAVQNLNAVLSLAHVHRSADAILAFDNDSLHRMCSSQLSIKKVSFSDVNGILSKQLAHALLPSTSDPGGHLLDPLNDVARLLTPHPEFKMVAATMAPLLSEGVLSFTTYRWQAVLRNLQQLVLSKFDPSGFDAEWQLRHSFDMRRIRSFAQLLICRGTNSSDLLSPDQGEVDRFKTTLGLCPAFDADGFHVRTHAKPFCKMDKSAVLLSNDCSQMARLDTVVDKAWGMFTSRAYIHQYKRYGLEEDNFVDCFVALEQLLCSYANL